MRNRWICHLSHPVTLLLGDLSLNILQLLQFLMSAAAVAGGDLGFPAISPKTEVPAPQAVDSQMPWEVSAPVESLLGGRSPAYPT